MLIGISRTERPLAPLFFSFLFSKSLIKDPFGGLQFNGYYLPEGKASSDEGFRYIGEVISSSIFRNASEKLEPSDPSNSFNHLMM